MTDAIDHEHWMRMALTEAQKGYPRPNPRVGAAIVRDGKLLSLGYHERSGLAHAEVMAIANANNANLHGATLYCTLEPCNHQGKTGPCTQAIIEAGIGHVVFATRDPMPHGKVSGEKALREAGINVMHGILDTEARHLIRAFAHHAKHQTPYITLKAALSLDGKLADANGQSKWISNEQCRAHAHHLRAEHEAVCVGVDTVIADDPQLNVRLNVRHRIEAPHPVRVVLDSHLRTPLSSNIIQTAKEQPTWLITTRSASNKNKVDLFLEAGAEVHPLDASPLSPESIRAFLGSKNIRSILVEGGAKVVTSFLNANIAQECVLYYGNQLTGSGATFLHEGIKRLADTLWTPMGDGMMVQGMLAQGSS